MGGYNYNLNLLEVKCDEVNDLESLKVVKAHHMKFTEWSGLVNIRRETKIDCFGQLSETALVSN
jgi:hypothetical protein